MLKNYVFSLEYKINGILRKSEGLDNEDYSITIEDNGYLKYILHPKKELEMINAYLSGGFEYAENARVFVNGYQSWTTTREYKRHDIQPGLKGLGKYQPVRSFCAMFGDYSFQKYYNKPGMFHSYSYTYVNDNGNVKLLGTTNERTGYTVFHHNMNNNTLIVQKDVEGVTINEDYVIFELYETDGTYDAVFDNYFGFLNFPKPRLEHMSGYTSWYNYYGTITEEQINRDLDGLCKVGNAADIFQIDDGFQTKVGDWECNTKKFPGGMRKIVDKIHDCGYLAGLWMAPFSAARSSVVAKEHPEWFVKIPGTNKLQPGVISWGGGWTFDFYIKEAADHIRKCFDRVINEWGFNLVKLDFLYSVCQTPRYNKSRGQIMCEAMDFLRECVGEDVYILGCGVPLFPAFGKVDLCRISCDVATTFPETILNKTTNQEFISAKNAMNNTVFRRHLNGRVWVNDPDVFYLRDNDLRGTDPFFVSKGILRFTEEQKLLLAEVNNTCGDVLFVSDNVGGYSDEKLELVKKFFIKTNRQVIDAEYVTNQDVVLTYKEDGKVKKLKYNVYTGKNITENA